MPILPNTQLRNWKAAHWKRICSHSAEHEPESAQVAKKADGILACISNSVAEGQGLFSCTQQWVRPHLKSSVQFWALKIRKGIKPETVSSRSVSCCLEKETNLQLSTTTLQEIVESDKMISESPFLQAKQPQLPQLFFIWLVFLILHQPCCPPLGMLNHLNVLPKLRGPELDTKLKVWPDQCRVQWKNDLPAPAGHTIPDTGQDAIGPLSHLGTLLAHGQRLSYHSCRIILIRKHTIVLIGNSLSKICSITWMRRKLNCTGCQVRQSQKLIGLKVTRQSNDEKQEQVTQAEEAPPYNQLPAEETHYALFTDGSCRIVVMNRKWKAAVWSPTRQVAEATEGEGGSSQLAELKAVQLALDIAEREGRPRLYLYTDSWMVANSLWGWLKRWKEANWQHGGKPIWAAEEWKDIATRVDRAVKIEVSKIDLDWEHKGELFLARWAHDASGHQGRDATYKWARDRGVDLTLDSISQVIHDCETCAAIKQAKRVKPLWYGGRWSKYKYGEAWKIDYITLPQTRQGKRYVLTMVEATMGWLETYPVPHATAQNTILGLEKQVLWRHGTPERIESDNGTHFKNSLINTWAREHGIEWVYHIPYHAPAAGKVERHNALLKTQLKALGGDLSGTGSSIWQRPPGWSTPEAPPTERDPTRLSLCIQWMEIKSQWCVSEATIRDLCKAHRDYGRDSPYFRGLLHSNLEAAVVIPADLRQLFSCLLDSTEFKLWEAAWRQLLREALPSLLTDPETAVDENGNALTLEQLMGEGRWTDPTDQASSIPTKALQTIREHAVTAFFSTVTDGPVIPYYKIVQGTKEAFTRFVERLT
ncbi:hypothetical protein DUI87_08204 [Hirundo rustica rustica]|uniref:Uncharacterized protein n=1 Tax=Hirundo rustica rustica TaxID=333673 RepID=A0A3M0L9S7_HIRRU|nr:hypothetical protein DUI87_08204 [Hirundo rustica rustica]